MSERELLASIHAAALRAVHAGSAVVRALRDDPALTVRFETCALLAAGKAACAMARGAAEVLGSRIDRGLVVTKQGHAVPVADLDVIEAAHPIPDVTSVAAAERALALAAGLGESDALLALISGGASALLCAPASGLTLAEKRAATRELLRSGAEIGELNAVRKHLSRIKGGGLLAAALPARVVTLAVSDVADDVPDAIASGPTVPDPTTFADALAVLAAREIEARVPSAIRRHLEEGAAGRVPETLKPESVAADRFEFRVVARLEDALRAAVAEAEARGQAAELLGPVLYGEARALAASLAARAVRQSGAGGRLLVAGGEPSVRVRGAGTGGRCQELALAFALEIAGLEGVTALFAGTDGSDGPTPAAGAFADGTTLERAAAQGLDARDYLERNDSHPLLAATGDLLVTGPTATNVTDLALIHIAG